MESSEILHYVLKVVMIHGIFFLLYFLLLRNKTSHRLNRAYLLATLLCAFFIPALEFSIPEETIPVIAETPTFYWEEDEQTNSSESIVLIESPSQRSTINYWTIVKWGYIVLSIGLFLRSIFHLVILQKLKYQSEYVERQWFKLFRTTQSHPFSFLSNVFIPKVIFGTNSFDQILEHECEHVRQHHSLDRLLLDFMVALFWFNPFIFLYRKALIEIHEYQADAAVLKKFPDPIEYQEVLFSQLSTASYSGLVSHFNFSTIKKRIVMINKRNNKRSTWAYVLAVPVTLWVILAFSGRVSTDPLIDEPSVEKVIVVEESTQDNTIPSILPIEDSDKVRMVSGFGMRMHPTLKERKMHLGMDFTAPLGTLIIGTADGVVSKVSDQPGGYGKMIMISHGDRYQTRYAHLSSIEVKEGDSVKKGERIGLSGNSGMSSTPHLHYEVIEVGVGHQDPVHFIGNYKFKAKDMVPPPPPKETKQEEELARVAEQRSLEEEELILEEAREIQEREALATLEVIEEEERLISEEEREEMAKVVLLRDDETEDAIALESEIEEITGKSRYNGKEPLFVLDGEIIEGTNELSPDDIKSIEVIKGKSAIKKYGKKGKNGVVEIESKKGDKTKVKVKNKTKVKDAKGAYNGSFRVLIDAGHGGEDSGAISPSGKLEKNISLAIAKLVKANFTDSESIEIMLSRDKDVAVTIRDRVEQSKSADLMIALHTDTYSVKNESYIVPIYNDLHVESEKSKQLANLLAQEFNKSGKEAKVGYSSGYYLLKNAECPAVMLQVGWFSKAEEDIYLSSESGQKEVAQRISSAIKLAAP